MKAALKKLRLPFALGCTVFILLRFVFCIGYVPTESMEPTISKCSYIVAVRIWGNLRIGDIVLFKREDKLLVKRIAAAAGDVVYVDRQSGDFSVNEAIENIEGLPVPKGCYFMVGDNREASSDSRYWDDPFITENDIAAKCFSARNEYIEKPTYN